MNSTYAQKSSPVQKAADTKAASVLDSSAQSESLQRKADMANNAAQREEAPRPNNTGMPDNLKAGIESLSGFSMDDVRVHYNSSKPATVQAFAYTQGTDIHVAPGQEKCLPHEAWHVAQQMAGRVSPTTNINGMPVNDNAALEHEADVMGEKAVQCKNNSKELMNKLCVNQISVAQMIKCVCVSRPPNYKEYRIVDENYVLKGGECFVDKPWSSTGRNDVSADAYGYSNKQSDGVREMTLHRDHIIPHSKIMAFLDAAKPVSEKDATVSKPWIEDSLAVFYANARKSTPASGNDFQAPDDPELKAGKFLKDGITLANREMKKTLKLSKSDFDFIQKATGWMPANIFLAPCPKGQDPGDSGVDDTFAAADGMTDDTVKLFKKTYEGMIAFMGKKNISLRPIILNLQKIANLRSTFWKFVPSNWFCRSDKENATNPSFGTLFYSKLIASKDGIRENDIPVKKELLSELDTTQTNFSFGNIVNFSNDIEKKERRKKMIENTILKSTRGMKVDEIKSFLSDNVGDQELTAVLNNLKSEGKIFKCKERFLEYNVFIMEVNGYLQTHEKVSIDSVMDYFGNPEDQASFKDLVKRLYEECIKNRAKERKKEKEMELSARKEQKNKDKRSRDKRKK